MEFRLLRYFIAVADQQTISGAARQLHLSQPTLSRQLSELEEELGVQLFIRGNRRISLTNEGMYLLSKAREIVSLAEKTEANFKNSTKTISGEIHLGSGESDAIRIIAQSVKNVTDQHQDVQFHLYSGNAEAIFEKLENGLLDFGIIVDPPVDKNAYDYLQLPIKDTWGVLMHRDSDLSLKKVISPKDLTNQPLILSQQSIIYNELSGWFGKDIKNLDIRCTYNLIYNAAKMVEAKVGYAICLDKLIDTYSNPTVCFRPLYPNLTANLYLIWKKHQIFSKASSTFLKQLRSDIEKYTIIEK